MKRVFVLALLCVMLSSLMVWGQTGIWTEDIVNNRIYLINPANSVGIGTPTPRTPLEVTGRIISSGDVSGFSVDRAGVADSREETRALYGGWGFADNKSTHAVINYGHVGYNTYWAFLNHYQADWSMHTDMIIKAGKVGIGTTDPSEALEVKGLIRIHNANSHDNNSPGIVGAIDDDFLYAGQYLNHYGFGFHHYNDGSGYDGQNAYISGYYGVDIFTGKRNRIRINNNGNVGIGTVSPTHKLSVNGTVKAKRIVVSTSGWSDFVLQDEYQLMPLSEVEKSIRQNNHLPGIPSEKEVLENGVDVGDMQTKLLQKIEELTLYMIEQDKQVQLQGEALLKLQQENELLKQRLFELE